MLDVTRELDRISSVLDRTSAEVHSLAVGLAELRTELRLHKPAKTDSIRLHLTTGALSALLSAVIGFGSAAPVPPLPPSQVVVTQPRVGGR